jgi:ferredoxin
MKPLEIAIHERACRGCEICVDICPTNVFRFDEEQRVCKVEHVEDCIACLSCSYICPSHAITHSGHHVVKDFYRDREFCKRIARFL